MSTNLDFSKLEKALDEAEKTIAAAKKRQHDGGEHLKGVKRVEQSGWPVGEDDHGTVSSQVNDLCREMIAASRSGPNSLTWEQALKAVLEANPSLAEKYRGYSLVTVENEVQWR